MLFPRDKDTGRPGWIARNLCQGQDICQEQMWGLPSACKSIGGARSRAIPYLLRHEAPSYPPAA